MSRVNKFEALSDSEVVHFVSRGTSVQITIHQEDIIDREAAMYIPAKSFTLCSRQSIAKLRDFLNTLSLEENTPP